MGVIHTRDPAYAQRLRGAEVWWKRLVGAQRPFAWNLRRLNLGFVLDLGCGTGRNLVNLGGRAAGIGVDHNPEAVAHARARGLEALSPAELRASPAVLERRFDTLLASHVLEHMTEVEAVTLLADHLPFVRPGGRAVLIVPQEAGFRSDPTHVERMDGTALERIARACGLEPLICYSFPLPRVAGRFFRHNETVMVAACPR